ncbi:MAG: PAAR domain-containing protein [Anaerolineae bacterium]|jgi:uncharacterized Zn-binding protein involved in type VI secretion|nr:PAAR domain-containing protein [Anaerolineae bacterium]
MGQPAAKQGDKVAGVDIHIEMVPSPTGPVPTPIPHPFNGTITGGCSANVKIGGMPAATLGSTADNLPPHIFVSGPFQVPPTNKGTVNKGSGTVKINGKPAARMGDTLITCTDAPPPMMAMITAAGNVMIGG